MTGLQSQFDTNGMSPAALAAFRQLEAAAGRGFGVNSAYRDPATNSRVGGARRSQHMQGNAFDINVADLSHAERVGLIQQARQAGFGGIGVYNNALHFDVGATRHWGPDYTSGSLPSWAADAVGAARNESGIPQGETPHSNDDGHDHGQPPQAMPQQGQAPQGQIANVQPVLQFQQNPLDPAAFQSQQPNRLAPMGFDPQTNPFAVG